MFMVTNKEVQGFDYGTKKPPYREDSEVYLHMQ